MPDSHLNNSESASAGRVGIIKTVQTPLGFFVLVVLVVEVILGSVASISQYTTATITVVGMLFVILSLIAVVAYLAYVRPEALVGQRPPDLSDGDNAVPERIAPTRVYCATTTEFASLGFNSDVAVIEEWYPIGMSVQRDLTSEKLTQHLTESNFEIVHLLGFIDPINGDFVFNRQSGDRMSPDGLAALVQTTGARLVFLATCDSVYLAAKLSPFTNIVAAHGNVKADDLISWEKCFYRLLSQGQPLSRAYDVAGKTSELPMILHMLHDMTFVPICAKSVNAV